MSEVEQQEEEQQEEQQEEAQVVEFDYAASQAEKASQGGWKPLDEFVAGGKAPEEWVDASTFNVRGEFIGKLKAKDKDIDARLANVNKIHEAQMEVQRNELTQRRDAAVLEGGKDNVEVVKNIDFQMGQLNQVPITPAKDPAISEWEANNSWIDVPGPKSVYANTLFSQAMGSGKQVSVALQEIDAEIARQFPTQTLEKTAISEKGSKPGRTKGPSKSLSMSDVTTDEQKWRSAMPDAWPDDKAFLKAVQDSRKTT